LQVSSLYLQSLKITPYRQLAAKVTHTVPMSYRALVSRLLLLLLMLDVQTVAQFCSSCVQIMCTLFVLSRKEAECGNCNCRPFCINFQLKLSMTDNLNLVFLLYCVQQETHQQVRYLNMLLPKIIPIPPHEILVTGFSVKKDNLLIQLITIPVVLWKSKVS